jgi:hypothetical protein
MTELRPSPIVLSIDVHELAADAVTVDILARLVLTARRLGAELHLANPTRELRELASFMGLSAPLGIEPWREPEQREQGLGVEEERELGDPPA